MTTPIVPSITNEQLAKLERLSDGANQSGWYWDDKTVDEDGYTFIPECSYLVGSICLADQYEGYQEDCNFIEAAKPAVIKSLIARLRAAEKDWAKEALAKGFEYVRESDDHYVVASPEEMVNLLRDVIGIDIRMKDGSSYGESISELKEQVDGLVNTVHALEEFRKDAERLEWLDGQVEAYGFQDIHEGNRWIIEGPFSSIHRAIDAAMEQSK